MDLKKAIESLLFSSGKVMHEKDLSELTDSKHKDVAKAIQELKKDYEERNTSLMIVKVGEGWKLNVKEKYVNLVTKIVADTELPFPVLETLAIITYKSPAAMQADVVKARGTNAYEHISELIDAGFIERRKEGRSFKIFLTPKFFEYFDVEGEKDIKEYLKDVHPSEVDKRIQKGKLGKLDVVDVPHGEKKSHEQKEKQKLFGDLEVVEGIAPAEEKPFEGEKGKPTIDDNKPDEDFLSKIENQINQIGKKNDERDDDEDFKRKSLLDEENKESSEEGERLGTKKDEEVEVGKKESKDKKDSNNEEDGERASDELF